MGNWSLGSVSASVLDLLENVPTAISGTRLLEMADRQRQFCEDFTGQSIGSNSIGIKFQSAILNLTMSETLQLMNTIGIDASSISLGDFSESKGGETNLIATAKKLEERGLAQLQNIGTRIKVYKAFGVCLGMGIFLSFLINNLGVVL